MTTTTTLIPTSPTTTQKINITDIDNNADNINDDNHDNCKALINDANDIEDDYRNDYDENGELARTTSTDHVINNDCDVNVKTKNP